MRAPALLVLSRFVLIESLMPAAEPVAVRAKGLPFEPECLSVVSYNLLAPLYVRPVDARTGSVQAFAAFEWAEPAAERLDWEARRPRLVAELAACGADVICLQEVQFERADAPTGAPAPVGASALSLIHI